MSFNLFYNLRDIAFITLIYFLRVEKVFYIKQLNFRFIFKILYYCSLLLCAKQHCHCNECLVQLSLRHNLKFKEIELVRIKRQKIDLFLYLTF